ncbi:MAG TPA: anaerobic ribonucleoside-triphosphate reductase [Candidatus Goldiibacteriota bacterium]|jgi:ribonucleoside-triphosphate reductase|nr:anaerobic ribonucleoside-triphosphate reductase [Candidatus Goldiibacteriota bacterium]
MEKKEIAAKIEELETRLQQVKGTECEVYSRIVGYFRPVKQWNNGKQEEYTERETFIAEHAKETAEVLN